MPERGKLGDPADSRAKRERYEQLRSSLWSDRSSFDSHWREIAEWMLPRRVRFFASDRNKGDKRNQNIIDSTARFAARTLQSGLHAGLTSPARPWFNLTTPDPTLAERQDVKQWLHTVTERMQVVFTDSNLYNVLPTVYGDLGVFGTGCMAILEDDQDLFRCYAYPLGSFAMGLNHRNIVTTFVRDYELTVRQVVEQFVLQPDRSLDWGHVSVTVKTLWDRSNYQAPVELTWIVAPNDYADPQRLESRYFPFHSCHFEKGESQGGGLLKESGFRSFPVLAPRWDVTAEDTYGTDCPGMSALGDVKQLQTMQREKAKAIKKTVDPPLVGSPELRSQKTSLLPGDITYVRDPQHGLRAVHEVGLNLEHLVLDIGQTQYRIQRAFYEDLFLMMATADQQMGADRPTAREVQERHEEKLLALGPVLERTNDELLDPLIERAYLLMDEAGLIPEPPEELDGVALKVEYISIMAQAQKLVGVTGQDRFVNAMIPMLQVAPQVMHKLNVFKIVDNYAAMLGIDPSIVKTDEEANQALQQQEQAQAAAMAAEQAKTLAGAAKDASAAPLEGGGSALDALMNGNPPPATMPPVGPMGVM
jgi:hypothetical protein